LQGRQKLQIDGVESGGCNGLETRHFY
jgi:hypothetical protein